MKIVKVGVSRGNSLFSKLICFFEKSNFSHIYFNFYSESLKRDIIYHANPYGVSFVNKENFLKHSSIIQELDIEITEDSYKKIMQFCIDHCGEMRYAFKGLIGKLLIYLRLTKDNIFKDGFETVDCNELVQNLLQNIGIDIKLNPELSGPKALFNYLKERNLYDGK